MVFQPNYSFKKAERKRAKKTREDRQPVTAPGATEGAMAEHPTVQLDADEPGAERVGDGSLEPASIG